MAYNVIPKTFEEAGKAVKHMDTVRAAEALRLFNVLTEKYEIYYQILLHLIQVIKLYVRSVDS